METTSHEEVPSVAPSPKTFPLAPSPKTDPETGSSEAEEQLKSGHEKPADTVNQDAPDSHQVVSQEPGESVIITGSGDNKAGTPVFSPKRFDRAVSLPNDKVLEKVSNFCAQTLATYILCGFTGKPITVFHFDLQWKERQVVKFSQFMYLSFSNRNG